MELLGVVLRTCFGHPLLSFWQGLDARLSWHALGWHVWGSWCYRRLCPMAVQERETCMCATQQTPDIQHRHHNKTVWKAAVRFAFPWISSTDTTSPHAGSKLECQINSGMDMCLKTVLDGCVDAAFPIIQATTVFSVHSVLGSFLKQAV